MNTVGDRLRIVREHYSKKQNEFSKKLGMKQPTYNAKENNTAKLSFKTINILIKELNVSIDWLLTGEGRMFNYERLEDFKKMTQVNNIKNNNTTIHTTINGDAIVIEQLQKEIEYLKNENALLRKNNELLEKLLNKNL